MNALFQLQQATLAARQRTGDKHIGTRIEAGRVQVVRAVPTTRGRFDVLPLSGWMTAQEAVDAIRAI